MAGAVAKKKAELSSAKVQQGGMKPHENCPLGFNPQVCARSKSFKQKCTALNAIRRCVARKPHFVRSACDCIRVALALAPREDLLADEVAEGGNALRLPELLGIGKEDGDVVGLGIGKDPFQIGKVLDHIVRQNADADVRKNRKQGLVA